MKKRAGAVVFAIAAIGAAVALVLVWFTFVVSLLNSCGAGDYGPNPGAEEKFCGWGSGEPRDYSVLFVFVQFIPAVPVLVGGLLSARGRSLLFFAAGVGVVCSQRVSSGR